MLARSLVDKHAHKDCCPQVLGAELDTQVTMVSLPLDNHSIQVSCQQTRFHVAEDAKTREIDVRDLNISIVERAHNGSADQAQPKRKGTKARPDGLEILSGAHLRIKAGGRYGFVGRNGSGKSTLLRTVTEKLIPALPQGLRVAGMRQFGEDAVEGSDGHTTVLEYVTRSDAYRNRVERELSMVTQAIDNAADLASTLKTLELEKTERRLFEVDKAARLRSGARGFDVRKVLREAEKDVETARKTLVGTGDSDTPDDPENDMEVAVALQGELQARLDALPFRDVEAKARSTLAGLGFTDAQLNAGMGTLSGGWRMRCQLAAALVQTADVLVLDEPTNFLDMTGMLWLQKHLEKLHDISLNTAVILVSHDRDFVNATCEELIILRDKQLTYFPGNLDSYDKSIRHETLRLTRMKEAQERQIAHMTKTVTNSIQQGKKTGDDNKLRQAKSRQKKLDERMGMEVSAKGGRFKLNRDLAGYHLSKRDEIDIPAEEAAVHLQFPPAPEMRFESSLISLEGVSYRYPKALKPTLDDIHLVIHPGDRIGIVGLNGAGKSTLVQLLTGLLQPRTGAIERYSRLKVGFYSQHAVDELIARGAADDSITALSLVMQSSESTVTEQDARKLLAGVGLYGRTVSGTRIAKLSGGQLVRLAFAMLFLDPPHVFVLDEPSTHLDLATVIALTEALRTYNGAAVLVSHDRYLLRTVIEGESLVDDDSDSDPEEEIAQRNRMVYEIKNARLKALPAGIAGWEGAIEKKLAKAGLI